MRCPRCNSYVKYGKMQCKKCGLHFRYSENAESTRKRSTAAIFARVGGVFGLHDLYLGYYLLGVIRVVLFVAMCGLFIAPQLVNITQTGMFRIANDFVGIAGAVLLVINIISYVLAVVESMRISMGIKSTDSNGFVLR